MTARVLVVIALVTTSGCKREIAGGEANGAKIFAEVCARCHGAEGEPNASMVARYGVKNLRSEHVQNDLSDADIRNQILKGSKNKQMPSFEGALTKEQIAAVIAHVRTFRSSRLEQSAGEKSGDGASGPDKRTTTGSSSK